MAKVNKGTPKRRRPGRPATGRDPAVTVRLPEKILDAVKVWGKKHGIGSRSETIHRLVELGLKSNETNK
jgi:hypothetical protein